MKIEIDLNDILQDEDGSETLRESVERQVVEVVAKEAVEYTKKTVKDVIENAVQKQIDNEVSKIVTAGLDTEYSVTDAYGKEISKSTLRSKITEEVRKQTEYKTDHYISPKNSFSKAIDSAIGDVVLEATEDIRKKVDRKFKEKVLTDAVTHIKRTLAIK